MPPRVGRRKSPGTHSVYNLCPGKVSMLWSVKRWMNMDWPVLAHAELLHSALISSIVSSSACPSHQARTCEKEMKHIGGATGREICLLLMVLRTRCHRLFCRCDRERLLVVVDISGGPPCSHEAEGKRLLPRPRTMNTKVRAITIILSSTEPVAFCLEQSYAQLPTGPGRSSTI